MIKIDKKIVGYDVAKASPQEPVEKPEYKREGGGDRAEVIRMHEKLERPEMLIGSTYKVKTPVSDHAMYVTINDIILNEYRPYSAKAAMSRFSSTNSKPFSIRAAATGRLAASLCRRLLRSWATSSKST